MNKFKVGDRIKFTEGRINEFKNHPKYGVKPGQTYTVLAVEESIVRHTLPPDCTEILYGIGFASQENGCVLAPKPIIIVRR